MAWHKLLTESKNKNIWDRKISVLSVKRMFWQLVDTIFEASKVSPGKNVARIKYHGPFCLNWNFPLSK